MTATATWGASAGANETNQACGSAPRRAAVPVLPATVTPGICAAVPVPLWTTDTIIAVIAAAFSGESGRENCSVERRDHAPTRVPDLGHQAAAISSHRSRSRRRRGPSATGWPRRPAARSPRSRRPDLGLERLGRGEHAGDPRDVERDEVLAGLRGEAVEARLFRERLGPSSRPISPNVTLHESRSASASVIVDRPPTQCEPPKFWSVSSVSGRSSSGGFGHVLGAEPVLERRGGGDELERRARREEPVARPRQQGLLRSAFSAVLRPRTSTGFCDASRFGSYDGSARRARTSSSTDRSRTGRRRPAPPSFLGTGSADDRRALPRPAEHEIGERLWE